MPSKEEDDCYDIQHDGGDGEERRPRTQEERYGNDMAEFKDCCDGMNRDRGCTDIPFFIVWVAFLVSLGYLTHLGFTEGSVAKLVAPVDGEKRFCGWKNESRDYDFEEYTNLMITDWGATDPWAIFDSGVCVKECPTG